MEATRASAASLREVGLQILGFEVLVDYGNAFPCERGYHCLVESLRSLCLGELLNCGLIEHSYSYW